MRACREAGHPHETDNLALGNLRAVPEAAGEPGEMGIEGLEPVGMGDDDAVAGLAAPAPCRHHAIAHGLDRRAGGGRVVNALMGP